MNGLTLEEKSMVLRYASGGADFMYEPSSELCNMLVNDSPQTHGINYVMIAILLERKPIRLDSQIVIKYCQGRLDKNNTWLFDNGDIRVVPHQLKKPVKLKSEEDDTKKEENSNG